MLWLLASCFVLLALAGLGQTVAGALAVRRFARVAGASPAAHGPRALPGISVLKPLCGDEPQLEAALASVCRQAYPTFQIVFGVQDPHDAAIGVVERLQARFPGVDMALVVNAAQHGANRKIGNLINMFPRAKHEVLVIADSDVHVAPDYLTEIAEALHRPGVGLVTTLYAALAANPTRVARLGATAITHTFLPGALLARGLGREDCLGATMALRRTTLAEIGGLAALADHLADDNVLGRLVRERGHQVALARTVPATTVPEERLASLYRHELRWARTIVALVPVEFALSSIQHVLAWALAAAGLLALAGAPIPGIGLYLAAWAIRAGCTRVIDTRLGLVQTGLATPAPIWLLPLRDLLSLVVFAASYGSDRVEWRGHELRASSGSEQTAPPFAEASRQHAA